MGNKGTTYVDKYVYPSGNYYTGEMKAKKRHGTGTYTWIEDGCTYEGDWFENQQSGKGSMTFKNGNKFVGSFLKNNIHGEGVLTTRNGETISGSFYFKQRMITTDGPKYPVGEYELDVDVTSSNGSKQKYVGMATLHIYTGMLVLPGMAKPDAPIFDAIVVVDPISDSKNQFAVAENVAGNVIPVAQAVPIVDGQVIQAPGQGPITAEEGMVTGVAFGKQDEAYEKEVRFKSRPYNPLNPKNYF